MKDRSFELKIMKKIVLLGLSACAAMMLSMDFSVYNFPASFQGKSLVMTILTIVFFKMGEKLETVQLPKSWVFKLFAFLLSVLWLMGESFKIDDTLRHITGAGVQMVKSLIYICGAAYLIYQILRLFYKVMDEKIDVNFELPEKYTNVLCAIKQHSFASTVIFLLICWAIPVIASYPANMCNDAWTQLSQFWGYMDFTTHHPPVHTLIIGFFTWFGTLIGSANVGLYLFVLVQTALYAVVIAYSVSLMRKLSAPKWLIIFTLITTGFSPYYANSVNLVLKDNLYSLAVLLFMIELIFALTDYKAFLNSKKHLILTAISIIGVILLRNNGKHILYPTIAVIIVVMFVKRKTLSKQVLVRGLAVLLIPVIAATVISSAVIKVYDIQPGSLAESLSLPFQQTARYVWEYEDEVTEAEKEAISAILDYENLADNYDASISDPVKGTYNRDATSEDLKNYFKVWFDMFLKHPGVYIEAPLNQSYYLLYPFRENDAVYVDYKGTFEDRMEYLENKIGLEEVTTFSAVEKVLSYWYYFSYSAPVTGLFSHPAIYTIALLFLILLALVKKLYRLLIPALPLVISAVVIIFAPVIQYHPRYAFPIIYTIPVLTAYFIYAAREKRKAELNV